MGRRKKDSENQLEEELNLEEAGSEDEASEEELELQQEPADEAIAETLEEELPKEPPAKPARKRAAKAEAKADKAEKAAEEIPVAAAAIVAQPAVSTAGEDLTKQWDAARQTSESIVASLEKVNGLLREIPEHYSVALQKALKPAKPSAGSKIAFGMSMLATLLSVLSLSFSQTARQAALNRVVSVPAVHEAPAKPAPEPVVQAAAKKPADERLAAKGKKKKSRNQ